MVFLKFFEKDDFEKNTPKKNQQNKHIAKTRKIS